MFSPGRMDLKDADTRKQTQNIKRPFGVAALDVTDILKGTVCDDDEKQYFIPFQQSVSQHSYYHDISHLNVSMCGLFTVPV